MKFKLEVDMSNAAFDDESCGASEMIRILEEVVKQLHETTLRLQQSATIRDINGHLVGAWRVTR